MVASASNAGRVIGCIALGVIFGSFLGVWLEHAAGAICVEPEASCEVASIAACVVVGALVACLSGNKLMRYFILVGFIFSIPIFIMSTPELASVVDSRGAVSVAGEVLMRASSEWLSAALGFVSVMLYRILK